MNIQLITSNFPPMVGGMETHVYQLAKNLSQEHDVEVLWITDINRSPPQDGFEVHKIPADKYNSITTLNILFRAREISKHIQSFKPDILHSHNIGHNISIRLINPDQPVIFTNHSSSFLNEFYRGRKKDMLKFRLSFDHLDYCITPSHELGQATSKITETPVIEIPNGVDIQRFHPNSKQHIPIENDQDQFIVLTTRRFEKKNGMWYLAKAIPKTNKNIKFILIGDGSQRKEIQDWINKNNLNSRVEMPGEVQNNKIHKYYAQATVSVIPSLKEAISISALESMASGTPVIGTNVGGLPEIIENNKNGFLIPPKDSESLADLLNELYSCRSNVENMGQYARETVEKSYSWGSISEKTINLYSRMID